MPFLFLSPSTQYFNPYITTGDERYWMNALADEMMPYLHASGITVTRNDPDGSAAQSIRDSNASRQDFHLALHSNAAPQALSGRLRGVDIYYYPTSEAGLRTNWRFSPGYGDAPLSMQPALLRALGAPGRLAVSCTDSFLLVPSKSITAAIGLFEPGTRAAGVRRSCATCSLGQVCMIRKQGRTCHG